VAGLHNKKYYLRVKIAYSRDEITSKIIGSENLKQEDNKIHSNAIVWHDYLNGQINIFLRNLSPIDNTPPGDSFKFSDYKKEIIKIPAIGNTSETRVGDSMISTILMIIVPTLILENDVVYEETESNWNEKFTVLKGKLPLAMENSTGRIFSKENWVHYDSTDPSNKVFMGGIYLNNDNSQLPKIYYIEGNSTRSLFTKELPSNINGKIEDSREFSDVSFKRELVYSGRSGNTITILYREFMNDMARPAFTQEIKYDISSTKIIGYKNAKFEVIDADNVSIKYKTLEQLE